MSKKGGKKAAGGGELSRFLQPHLQTITDTLQVCPRRIPESCPEYLVRSTLGLIVLGLRR
jgi:hypothetical protein